MNKEKLKKIARFINIFNIILIIIVIIISTLLIGVTNNNMNNLVYDTLLKQNLVDKNLNVFDKKIIGSHKFESDLGILEYNNFIKNNFKYDKNYDCKYWALQYILYAKKHNIDYKVISLKEHIFVIYDYKDKYCILDQTNFNCYKLIK